MEKSNFFRYPGQVVLVNPGGGGGSKVCPKLLYLLQFLRYTTFSISAKIKDGSQKSENSKFFRGARGVAVRTLGDPKFAQNCSISYGFRDKRHFPFPQKFKMAAENRRSLNFSEVLEQ